ncbi:Predicted dehydrogenase [Amycolatopsis arida]|uniref:Predicted dehydrogenase n=1 Tax=Amycolatopsis arida TaxID=587909 RepID=A0A1I5ZTY0_9PSEU|nr:Gfo/Idh/MocA family oxidoreductase [Amycolatopsis arida]TDX89363.1 putative dehydrogenase [Amycolatopsis arida]SFQ59875.1 Predicted dehydrogenase [Amycolatopsis arida]
MPIRVAVVGLGAVAQAVYLPLLARRADLFTVTAVCDLAPDLRAHVGDRLGLPTTRRFATLDDLLDAPDIDAVILLTSGSHGAAVTAIAARGLPALCEKPLAYTRSEVDDIEAHDPAVLLGYMKQYDPAVRHAAELLADTDPARFVEVSVLHPSSAAQLEFARVRAAEPDPAVLGGLREQDDALLDRALGTAAPAHLRRLYAGVVLGSLVHDLAVLRTLGQHIDTVDHVATWAESTADPGSAHITGALAGGGRYALRWHYLPDYPAYRETVAVHHDTGSVELVFPSPYLLNAPTTLLAVDTRDGAERRAEHRSVVEAFEEELAAFAAMVTDGTPPLAGPAEGRADIVTCQRIVRAHARAAGIPIEGEAATA